MKFQTVNYTTVNKILMDPSTTNSSETIVHLFGNLLKEKRNREVFCQQLNATCFSNQTSGYSLSASDDECQFCKCESGMIFTSYANGCKNASQIEDAFLVASEYSIFPIRLGLLAVLLASFFLLIHRFFIRRSLYPAPNISSYFLSHI